jgi:hypothetical protein
MSGAVSGRSEDIRNESRYVTLMIVLRPAHFVFYCFTLDFALRFENKQPFIDANGLNVVSFIDPTKFVVLLARR